MARLCSRVAFAWPKECSPVRQALVLARNRRGGGACRSAPTVQLVAHRQEEVRLIMSRWLGSEVSGLWWSGWRTLAARGGVEMVRCLSEVKEGARSGRCSRWHGGMADLKEE